MLADTLTKRSAVARRTFELFLKNRQKWRLVYDPKFQSERRRTKAGLASSLDDETRQVTDNDGEEVFQVHYVAETGDVYTVQLVREDDWVKVPDTQEISDFMKKVQGSVATEGGENDSWDGDVLGSSYDQGARDPIDEKHEIGTCNLQPVPLLASHGDELASWYRNSEG